MFIGLYFFVFKQKTAYEMRISDWSSDVCSSDLPIEIVGMEQPHHVEDSHTFRRRRGIEPAQPREPFVATDARGGHIPIPDPDHPRRFERELEPFLALAQCRLGAGDRKSTRLNSSH